MHIFYSLLLLPVKKKHANPWKFMIYVCMEYDDSFAWGFLLGILGLLIVGFRAKLNETNRHPQKVIVKLDDAGRVEKLAKPHQQGIMTDEEFVRRKQIFYQKCDIVLYRSPSAHSRQGFFLSYRRKVCLIILFLPCYEEEGK